MENLWSTAFFWIAFSIISSIVLRYFYFSKSATLAYKLRLFAGACIIGVFVLLLFPWLPHSHGGQTGWGVILQGDAPMTILVGLLLFTLISLSVSNHPVFFKIGALTNIIATVFLFGLMIYTFPGTVSLEFRDMAPIFATLILLINNVVTLLLWHQLQVNKRSF